MVHITDTALGKYHNLHRQQLVLPSTLFTVLLSHQIQLSKLPTVQCRKMEMTISPVANEDSCIYYIMLRQT